jgi:hypothetical protein
LTTLPSASLLLLLASSFFLLLIAALFRPSASSMLAPPLVRLIAADSSELDSTSIEWDEESLLGA